MDKYELGKTMYIEGKSIKNICNELRITPAILSDKLKLDGIKIRGKSSTSIDYSNSYDKIIDLYNKGNSIRNINKITKIPRNKISLILKTNNVTVIKGKFDYDESLFEIIDTENKAYWLGMLYADGYVSKDEYSITLKLKATDIDHLLKFKQFLNTDITIHDEKSIGKHGQLLEAKRIIVSNKKICNDIISKGCINRKSLRLKFPTYGQVPKYLINHFVRGYLDGDGCIFIDGKDIGVNFVGTLSFLKSIQEIYNLGKIKIQDSGNAKSFTCKGNVKAIKFLDTIYKDATIFMDRKRNIYLNHKARLGAVLG